LSAKKSLRTLARLLFLLGGLILILGAVLQFAAGLSSLLNLAPQIPRFGSIIALLLAIVTGVVALAGIAHVSNPAWSVVLLVLGFLAWGLGGIIVIIGAIVALVVPRLGR
jgi:hypothetical protein